MAIIVKRKHRENRDRGSVSFEVLAGDVGKTYDFMGIAEGFRVTDVNVTVDEKFDSVDNTISVGIEGDYNRFVADTPVNAVEGIDFNNRQLTATQSMAIVVDVVGPVSSAGKATVTVSYKKPALSKQEY